jgi:hypothetical protein
MKQASTKEYLLMIKSKLKVGVGPPKTIITPGENFFIFSAIKTEMLKFVS